MASQIDGVLKHLQRFRCSNFDAVPETPGLYAWYSVPTLGPKDYQMDVVNGEDLGATRLREALGRHTSRFMVPPLSIHAQGRFTAAWRGEIPSEGVREECQRMSAEASVEDSRNPLEKVLRAPVLRALLVEVLSLSTPFLAAPLYIGVSDNLKRRLNEHRDLLLNYAGIAAKTPDSRNDFLQSGKNFALRAIGSGFSPDGLEAWTLSISEWVPDQVSMADLRVLAEGAEWLLNRWYRPLHGKR